jgi:hypothetical protein
MEGKKKYPRKLDNSGNIEGNLNGLGSCWIPGAWMC